MKKENIYETKSSDETLIIKERLLSGKEVEDKYRERISKTVDETLDDFSDLSRTIAEISKERLFSDLAIYVGINVKGKENEIEEIKRRRNEIEERLNTVIRLAKNLKKDVSLLDRNGAILSNFLKPKIRKIDRRTER
jgi:hypothetical protein